jgi:hypothetical protein
MIVQCLDLKSIKFVLLLCMYLYGFFYLNKNDKLIYISSPFSNQGLPAITSNTFLFIHPKSQCLHIVYTIITAIPTWNLRLSTDTSCPEAERLVTTANVTPKTTNSNSNHWLVISMSDLKHFVLSKSFSSLLIGCVRRPTPRTDKGSSSITDNMITFNGISVYNISNFEFKPKYYML